MNKIGFEFERDGEFTTVSLVIDDVTNEHQIFDFSVLIATKDVPFSMVDIFTCTCGVAGCAGYHGTLYIEPLEDEVLWQAFGGTDKDLGAEQLRFAKTDYDAAIEVLRADIIARSQAGEKFSILADWDFSGDEEIAIQRDPAEYFDMFAKHFQQDDKVAFAKECYQVDKQETTPAP